MAGSVDGISFYANQYSANLQMSMYKSDATVDLSLVEKYVSDTPVEESDLINQPTKVKNSTELLDEIRETKRDSAKLSKTLNGFSSLCAKANCSSDATAQKGANAILNVLANSGGSEAVNLFSDTFSRESDETLNKIFTQAGVLLESNATSSEVSSYISSLVDVKESGSKAALDGFLNSVDKILTKDYTTQAVEKEITNAQYKREVAASFLNGVSQIINSSTSTSGAINGLNELYDTASSSNPSSILEDISKIVDKY